MDNNELHLIATAWVDFHQRCRPGTGDVDFRTVRDLETGEDWAAQKLLDLIVNEPGVALQIIDLIISGSPDEWILTNLGAGPIEELFYIDNADIIGQLEKMAKRYPGALSAFQNVNQGSLSDLAETTLNRIIRGS